MNLSSRAPTGVAVPVGVVYGGSVIGVGVTSVLLVFVVTPVKVGFAVGRGGQGGQTDVVHGAADTIEAPLNARSIDGMANARERRCIVWWLDVGFSCFQVSLRCFPSRSFSN